MASTRDRSARAKQFRAEMKSQWQPVNAPCGICGQATIDWDGERNLPDSFELHHPLPVRDYPELEFDPNNARPSHSHCNRGIGAGDQPAGIGQTSEAW